MQKMRIVTMQLGMLATNCYLVINEETGELVIIDPAGEADRIAPDEGTAGGCFADTWSF